MLEILHAGGNAAKFEAENRTLEKSAIHFLAAITVGKISATAVKVFLQNLFGALLVKLGKKCI